MNSQESFIVAAAQATPIFLNREATLDKACDVIAEAGQRGARLIVLTWPWGSASATGRRATPASTTHFSTLTIPATSRLGINRP